MDDKNELTLQRSLNGNFANKFISCAAKGDLEELKRIESELTKDSLKIPAILYGALITDSMKNGHYHIVKYSLEKIGVDVDSFEHKVGPIDDNIDAQLIFKTINNQSHKDKIIVDESEKLVGENEGVNDSQ